MGSRLDTVFGQFVVNALVPEGGLEEISDHEVGVTPPLPPCFPAPDDQRRSKVIGKQGFKSSSGNVIAPDVCVMASNRSARRVSASPVFAGRDEYTVPFG